MTSLTKKDGNFFQQIKLCSHPNKNTVTDCKQIPLGIFIMWTHRSTHKRKQVSACAMCIVTETSDRTDCLVAVLHQQPLRRNKGDTKKGGEKNEMAL
jgi:hypothetical protein